MRRQSRLLALLFAFVFCFVTVFSVFYIAAEANHDCVGESCRICATIALCENTMKTVSMAVVTVVLAFVVARFVSQMRTSAEDDADAPTLVLLKTKLSN